MRKAIISLFLLVAACCTSAAEPPTFTFDIRINIADDHEVHLAATVPDRTSHQLQVNDDLGLELRVEAPASDRRWLTAALTDRNSEVRKRFVLMDWPLRDQALWQPQWISFSVCGDRYIMLQGAAPGRCADLQPMATADRMVGACGTRGFLCFGPYEAMPAKIESSARLAPSSEPGVPLRVRGRVIGPDGRPRAGVIVYGYQTDQHGIYPPVVPPRSSVSNFHGRLRGWVKTDANGRYMFDTIRPGSYGGNPEHIHMHIIEPGCATYIIDDLNFEGDPNLLALTPEQLRIMTPGHGGSGVTQLRQRGAGWEVTRDIHLGAGIADYVACGAATP
ncbi:MAG: hypothetical protein H6978_07140 [Gammaproteobacteria bacterium]|nr:hypothetical protein [Gammaproteobacteria bacterium]